MLYCPKGSDMKPNEEEVDAGDKFNRPRWLLEKHAPRLVEVLGLSDKHWASLAKKLSERMEAARKAVEGSGTWTGPTALVDLAFLAEFDIHAGTSTGRRALAFLQYVEDQAVQLASLIGPELRPTLRREMRDLFINFSAEQSKYLDKVGELAATVHLLRSTGGQLRGIEVKLPDLPTSLDVLVEMPTGAQVAVEFLNVHLDDDRLHSAEDLQAFLDGRVHRKIEDKLKKAVPAGEPPPFPLLLILWFRRVETLQKFAEYLVSRASPDGKELPVCALQQFGDTHGYVEWQFKSVAAFCRDHVVRAAPLSTSPPTCPASDTVLVSTTELKRPPPR